jgi:heat shock protein HtpX
MFGINQFRTVALLGLLSGLIVLAGYYLIGNETGLVIGLVIAAFTSVSSWYFSDQAALATYRAQPIAQEQAPELYDTVQRLSDRAGIPMPKLFVIPTDSPNAFATGRDPDHSTIAVTQGIVKLLSKDELDGVIAHELTHVKNRDTLIQAVAGTLAGAITYLGQILTFGALFGAGGGRGRQGNPLRVLFLIVLAPLSASLIQMAISRTREFAADQGSAEITGNPLALVSALQKLEELKQKMPLQGNPAFSHLFIVNPLNPQGLQALFLTHPPTEDRIRKLKELAQQEGSQSPEPSAV